MGLGGDYGGIARGFCSGGVGPFPEVGSEDGAFSGPGYQGEYEFFGVGTGVAVNAALKVAAQVIEGVEAKAGLAHAGYEHCGEIKQWLLLFGRFPGIGLIELVAVFHGEVPEAEDGQDGLEPFLEVVDLAA